MHVFWPGKAFKFYKAVTPGMPSMLQVKNRENYVGTKSFYYSTKRISISLTDLTTLNFVKGILLLLIISMCKITNNKLPLETLTTDQLEELVI